MTEEMKKKWVEAQNDSGYNFREIADWIEENVPVEVNA